MEVVLISRTSGVDAESRPLTTDYRLEINLAEASAGKTATQLPQSEWAGNSLADSTIAQNHIPPDQTYRPHALSGYSAFGSGKTNEFATFTMGKELFYSNPTLREECEDELRGFAERSDHTEGFMLTTPISNGFSGLSSSLIELIRDEFQKSKIFSTLMIENSQSWLREDTTRSINQRVLNEALSISSLEELCDMLLPIQPASSWESGDPWARYITEDLPKPDSYSQILTAHLQSANSELRGSDGLSSIINQLNWRGDNKICHISGSAPLLPPETFSNGEEGKNLLLSTIKDFSVLPNLPVPKDTTKSQNPNLENVFAQHSIVRGYADAELERFGPILEASSPLQEPLTIWLCLPHPYPLSLSSPPIFTSLLPSGRPFYPASTKPFDPFSPPGLNLPPGLEPLPPPTAQPRSIPILTTLSTSPAARHLLKHLSTSVKELVRIRSSSLVEYEMGEFGCGREGILECFERLETLRDCFGISGVGRDSDEEDGIGSDEDFGASDSDGF